MPSEAETAEIRSVLRDRCDRLTGLTEINTPSGTQSISSVSRAHVDLQAEIAGLRTLLSPSRKLAPELIAHIFELCIPVRELRESAIRANEAPLLVAQICHGWREVALSTPQLWTRMSIWLPLGGVASPDWNEVIKQAALASSLWLSRSGSLNVHVAVQYIPSDENRESDTYSHIWMPAVTELVSKLLEHCHSRIESLAFSLPVPCTMPLLHANCPSMTKLTITDNGLWRSGGYESHLQVYPNGVGYAGQLRELILDTPAFDLRNTRYPWDQLTWLYVRQQFPISMRDALTVLRLSAQLHTIMLTIGSPADLVPTEQVVVPNLCELWVYGGADESGAFMDAITVPKLTKLVIGDGHHQGSFLGFLEKLSRPLLYLCLHRIFTMSEIDLWNVLELVPSLVELSTDSTCHNVILDALLPKESRAPLCPRLESLTIRLHLANDELVELLDARCGPDFRKKGVAQLKKVHVTFMDWDQRDKDQEWDDAAWMQKVDHWRRQGIDIQIEEFKLDDSGVPWDGEAFANAY